MKVRTPGEDLTRSILHGLFCEWETSLWVLPKHYRTRMVPPLFSLKEMQSMWGSWNRVKREITINTRLVFDYSWAAVREVLLHETAHQLKDEVLDVHDEAPHGPAFKRACFLLRANPKASGTYKPLDDRLFDTTHDKEDKILMKVKKLLALSRSQNEHEAEAAMLKARELIEKYNVSLKTRGFNEEFISVFLGKPALRHPREDYHLASLIQHYYYVGGIWVPAFVVEKKKMGRVLEISGRRKNVQLAHYLFDYVRTYIDSAWKRYTKEKRLNRQRKTDFAIGVIEGFRSKLKEADKNPRERALVKHRDPLLDEYMAYKYPSTAKVRRKARVCDRSVLEKGEHLGRKLHIPRGIPTQKKPAKFLLEN